ncbi:DUF2889 domain-containing protein [Marinobacterium jannaschii]|uniref:DUF2889 domain-containing protein n=1 Tax=Marinobacterium jannaschii TaxID=64970 RepID=UPI000483920B|nr:DUF2889 domain-containing protein [Marinobacterium jannaschii]
MPLSKPQRRSLAHHRSVSCYGYQREDGLWDIEGHMTDIKSQPVDNPERGGYIAAGEAFHDMGLRITIDQGLLIHEVEAVIDQSPFRMCPGVTGAFRKLEGTRIGPGWQRQVKELLGGVQGCTHLSELLVPIATTAVQTLWPSTRDDIMKLGAQVMLNSCRTWAADSEVIKTYLPELYQAAPE